MNNLLKNANIKYIQNNHTNIALRGITPYDPYYNLQWAPAKIRLPDVWDYITIGGTTSTGDTIVVAVIDNGFDVGQFGNGHEDLSFWRNIYDIPDNGIDDDNNGYVDDYYGWNTTNQTGNFFYPEDHGTHVAGIVGATGNNNKGISGVNWNVKILPIIGFDRYNTNVEATLVEAYSYVLEMRALYNETNGQRGAFIVATNLSYGVNYDIGGNPDNYPIWCSMYDELGRVGILNCAATANANWNIDQVGDMPTSCPSDFLISVTNTTSTDIKNQDAGYGTTHIDIGAPGTDIYSTLPNNRYGFDTGTSFASPQVAGVLALMYAAMPPKMIRAYKSNPRNIALLVKQYLLDAADRIPSLNGLVASGRLNAYAAVESSSLCETTFFDNKTVTKETVIADCEISVYFVTVQNNAKLTLDFITKVTINSPFEVKRGSQLEIRAPGGLITGTGNTEGDPEGTWMLHKMEGEFIWDPEVWGDYFENDIPVNEWFTFTLDGTQLSGRSGCSSFAGNLASTGSFVFTGVLSNLVGCLPQIQNLEHLYVDFVRRATYMYVSGNTMYLFVDNEPVLEFYRQVE